MRGQPFELTCTFVTGAVSPDGFFSFVASFTPCAEHVVGVGVFVVFGDVCWVAGFAHDARASNRIVSPTLSLFICASAWLRRGRASGGGCRSRGRPTARTGRAEPNVAPRPP